jgi:hypothetical protein
MYRPKVGSVVTFIFKELGFKKWIDQDVEILSYSENSDGLEFVTFWNRESGSGCFRFDGHDEFRPIKSKRDEYCCEVYDILKNSQSIPECCERLYDAGYRKQMPYDDALDILIKVESLNLNFVAALEKLGYTPGEN